MTPERWRDIERVYHAALAATPETRAAVLAEACNGDAALEQEVESLLAKAAGSGVLDRPATHGGGIETGASRQPPMTGGTLGTYHVLEQIGEGGMGEVYRARDTRLGRDVAVKVLPASFASDAARRARFEREARVLASLNHPNIATLYGVEDAPTGPVLIMELVEGTTLADRLALGDRFSLADAPVRGSDRPVSRARCRRADRSASPSTVAARSRPRRVDGLGQTEVQTFAVPSERRTIFDGLRSRWMMPRSCAASSASATCRAIASS